MISYNKELYTAEAKEMRFIRVAEKRVNRILEDLRLLGNTSNKSLYKYSPAQTNQIFKAIETAITETKVKFHNSKKQGFKL